MAVLLLLLFTPHLCLPTPRPALPSPLPTLSSPERHATRLVAARLRRERTLSLRELLRSSAELCELCRAAQLRLAPLLLLSPHRFTLEPIGTDAPDLLVRAAGAPPRAADVCAVEARTADQVVAALLRYHAHRPSLPTEPVPVSWLLRALPSPVEALVVAEERLFHAEASRHCHSRRAGVWAACCAARLRRLASTRGGGGRLVWHEDGRLGRLALSRREAERQGVWGDTPRRLRLGSQPSLLPSSAPLLPASATLLPASDQLLSAGDHVLSVRGSSRTEELFAAELLAAAEHSALAEARLSPLASGLYLIRRAPPASFASLLPSLAGVRAVGTLLAAAPTAEAMAAALRRPEGHAALRRRAFGARGDDESRRWRVRIEQHFPSIDNRVLPFHDLDGLGEVSIALASALGGSFAPRMGEGVDESEESSGGGDKKGEGVEMLRLVQTKQVVLLVRECTRREGEERGLRCPRWVDEWEHRAFAFSSSLDPLVALAAVNLAVHTHLQRAGIPASELSRAVSSMHVLDPCMGSGTVLTAATERGFQSLIGSDINHEFVEKAATNLKDAGVSSNRSRLFVHDATQPYPPYLLDQQQRMNTLIVSNPPWGKNIGGERDGVAIVRSLVAQMSGCTMCWFVNRLALQALRCTEGVIVLNHIPLGSVGLVVCVAE
ncbi:hypothetical protein AB1Y20_017330 [Prymnesium parvum]|uniref:Ribosomal RNA large subunit methyltransferase K/L-like methyltransferase domain-containing protein n=1 Tax=Prymnesium parvum TaxID=97485 RepID=A0AB34JN39_PRYPA